MLPSLRYACLVLPEELHAKSTEVCELREWPATHEIRETKSTVKHKTCTV